MDIQIRPLDKPDLAEVVAGWNECWKYDQVTEQRFARVILDDPNYEPSGTLVATEPPTLPSQRKIVGFVCAAAREDVVGKDGRGLPEQADFGYLKGFFVREEYRDTDVGELLLDEAIRFVRAKGKSILRVVLYSGRYFFPGIDVRYEQLLRFFERHGFERIQLVNDLSINLTQFEPSEYHRKVRRRVEESGATITPYHPEMLEPMQEFVRKVNIPYWFPEGWEEDFGEEGHTLAALRGEEIVGWAEYWPHPERGGFGPIAVLPEERHQGIGTCLLSEAMLWMKAQGVPEAFAGWAATDFYLRSGWEICRQYAALEKKLEESERYDL